MVLCHLYLHRGCLEITCVIGLLEMSESLQWHMRPLRLIGLCVIVKLLELPVRNCFLFFSLLNKYLHVVVRVTPRSKGISDYALIDDYLEIIRNTKPYVSLSPPVHHIYGVYSQLPQRPPNNLSWYPVKSFLQAHKSHPQILLR